MQIAHIAHRDDIAHYQEHQERYAIAKYIIAALVCTYNFSLLVYLQPLLIGSSNLRLLVADGSAILFAVWLWSYLGCTLGRASRTPILSLLLALMVALSFISLLHGRSSPQIAKIDVFREFRVFLYFMLMLFIWLCRNATPGTQHEQRARTLIIVIIASSQFGAFLYIMVGKMLAPTPQLYGEFVAAYGDIGHGLSLAVQQKFKITPYAGAVLQSWLMFQVVIGRRKKITSVIIFALIALNAYVVLQSNMRSALGAFIAATFVPYVYAFRSRVRVSKVAARTVLALPTVVPAVAIIVFAYGSLFINERFTEQITEKGIGSVDVAKRADVLIGLFDFSAIEKFSVLGEGMGAGVTEVLWDGVLNPIDSVFFNVFLSMGPVAFAAFLLILMVTAYNAWLIWHKARSTRYQAMTEPSIAAGVMIFILNGFVDSPFLFVPDAVIAGSILGYISSAARQKTPRSISQTL